MSGAGLIDIKRRIKSVNNTKKITNAMGLIATSNLRQSRQVLEFNNDYVEMIKEAKNAVVANAYVKSKFVSGSKSNKKLYVVITSERGMCGSFNSNVVNALINSIDKTTEFDIAVVGSKGINALKRYKIGSSISFDPVSDVPTMEETNKVCNEIIESYLNDKYGEVTMVYSKFISVVSSEVQIEKILPMEINKEEGVNSSTYLLEPTEEVVFDRVAETYLRSYIYNVIINSKVSEHSLRMTAMDGATKNANSLIEQLTLEYNRIRQSVITQEITEIVGGAEAQR